MAKRRHVYAIRREPAPTPPEPNATVAEITSEIRMAWPPGTSRDRLLQIVADTTADAVRQIVRLTDGAEGG
jgi:hypothetical protein